MKTTKNNMIRLFNLRSSKIGSVAFKCLVSVGLLAAASANGQTTYLWTAAGDGTNFDSAANWGGTLPSTGNNDTCAFDGSVAGNLALNYSGGNFASGPGSSGINIYLMGTQTGSVMLDNFSANANPPNLAIYNVTIDSGAGAFSWGASNNKRINYAARPSGALHIWQNNSTNAAVIGNQIRWVAGGGSAYTMDFGGTGNWVVNNYLQSDNSAGGVTLQVDGPGTTTWNPSGYAGVDNINAININGGVLALVAPHPKIGNRAITSYGTFVFNAPSQQQSLSGVISGTGILQLQAGTLTLGGQSTYSGNTVLNGGELIVNGTENVGVAGPLGAGNVVFSGGTLGFSINNTFDYSARFSTDANQAYSFDTAGQNVTLATGLTSSGGTLTKLGPGTLTLAGANTYTGNTTIGAGKLLFQGTKSGSGNIVVANSTVLGVTENGSQITPATLTVGTTSGATLEFNSVASTSLAPLAAGSISVGGPATININSGTFAVGQSYPLLSWTGGNAPAVNLGNLIGAVGNLSTNGNKIQLNVTGLAYVWSGINSGNWDATTAGNWLQNGSAAVFVDGSQALFDDTATGETNVVLNAAVSPGNVTVNNNSKIYTITSSGANVIEGSGSLTKNGNSALTLSGGVNTYGGATIVNGGILSVGVLANGGQASDIGAAGSDAANLVLNGGVLRYTGTGASLDHLFTLGTAGGTIDNEGGTLSLSNAGNMALSGTGARTLVLSGTNASGDTLAAMIGDNGGATALSKTGSGTWILTGNNTNSGLTTVANGVLQIGVGGTNGAIGSGNIVNNGRLDFNVASSITVSGSVSGTGSITNDGAGTVTLNGNNSYSGGTTINAGSLQFGSGGTGGTLNGNAPIVNNGTLIFDTLSPISISGYGSTISGTGNVIVRAGFVKSSSGNPYTGWTEIDPGATFQPCEGQTGGMLTSVVTNNGVLKIVSQNSSPATFGITNNIVGAGRVLVDIYNQNAGWGVLAGTNTYTGGTLIGGGGLVLGDGMTPGAGSIVGSVIFTNTTGPTVSTFNTSKRLIFDRPDDFTFTNNIISMVSDGSTAANSGSVEQMGYGVLTLLGNNSYPGDTTIDAGGTLQVGTGGTGGSIGTGAVVANGTLIFNRSDSLSVTGLVSGTGSLIQSGSGTLTLSGANTFTGMMTVSNGSLYINGTDTTATIAVNKGTFGGAGTTTAQISMAAGTKFAPGGSSSSIGTLTINGGATLNGDLVMKVNKSLSQSNDVVAGVGYIYNSGTGTLTVQNLGPDLVVGDKFTLFSQPLGGGSALTVTGAGATWKNDLETDGSITVLTATSTLNPNPPVMQVTVSANALSLAWPTNRGWSLQTNSVDISAANQWFTYPGSEALTNVSIPINKSTANVFFRMVHTNTP